MQANNINRARALLHAGFYAQSERLGPALITALTPTTANKYNISLGMVFLSIENREVIHINKYELEEILMQSLTADQRLHLQFCTLAEYEADRVVLQARIQHQRIRSIRFLTIKQEWDYDHPCLHCGYVYLQSDEQSVRAQCCLKGKALAADYPKLWPLPYQLEFLAIERTAHMSKNCSYYNGALSLGE